MGEWLWIIMRVMVEIILKISPPTAIHQNQTRF